jgi:hypothetical protein
MREKCVTASFKSCGTDPLLVVLLGSLSSKKQNNKGERLEDVDARDTRAKGEMMGSMTKEERGCEQKHTQCGKTYDAQKIWREVRDK